VARSGFENYVGVQERELELSFAMCSHSFAQHYSCLIFLWRVHRSPLPQGRYCW